MGKGQISITLRNGRQAAVVYGQLPDLSPKTHRPTRQLSSDEAASLGSFPGIPQAVARRRCHDGSQGLMRLIPQCSKPPVSRVTTLAPLDRATDAIMRSTVAVGRPARLRAAKSSA